MDLQELLDRAEYTIEYQKQEIDKLRAEVARLTSEAGAHDVLKSIYRDPEASQTNRLKAAAASLPVEKPKMLSIVAPVEMDRREAWRNYQRWALRKQILLETRALPQPGWDAHLVGDSYVPPEGEDMPPKTVVRDPTSGYRVIDNMMPTRPHRVGNGGDGNGNGEDSGSE